MLGGFAGRFGLTQEQAARVACAFGGGMAGTGQTCGAVSGALVVLGLAHGHTTPADGAGKARTYAATKELWARFSARHGSLVCRELLGVDIATAEGRKTALETGLFKARCPVYVRDAAEIAAGLL